MRLPVAPFFAVLSSLCPRHHHQDHHHLKVAPVLLAQRMVDESHVSEAEVSAILGKVALQLRSGDDGGALQTLSEEAGDLLECQGLSRVASTFDEKTRSFVLDYLEEFSKKAADLDDRRKRELLALVEDVKKAAHDPTTVDDVFQKRRDRMLELDLLEHVEAEFQRTEKGPVKNFLEAVRDRLAAETIRALYAEVFGPNEGDHQALADILAGSSDDERLAALQRRLQSYDDLEERQDKAELFYDLLQETHEAAKLALNKKDTDDRSRHENWELKRGVEILMTELNKTLHGPQQQQAGDTTNDHDDDDGLTEVDPGSYQRFRMRP